MARPIRVVVGEGRTAQRGLLRFVLEGEGFDVVGEARGSADLSGVIDEQRPDVVVLDDGIGVMAVSMVREVSPQAKVVLVWPSAVVPIGGDARVEPARILKDLAPAVEQVVAAGAGLGAGAALTETFDRPDWIDKVRKDPATLRDKLEGGKEATKRPSVTHLQRRSKRLHPSSRRPKPAEREQREEVPTPVVLLPVENGGSGREPILDIGGGGSSGAALADDAVEERSEWNRRLGTLALSGAAAVSALVLALALGGGRIPATVVRGGGILPVGVPGVVRPGSGTVGPFAAGSLGGDGYDPTVIDEPLGPDQGGTGTDGGLGGGLAGPGTAGGSDEPATGSGDGGTGGDGTGGGDGGGGTGDGGGGTGGGGTGGGGGGGGTGGGGGGTDGGGGGGGGDDDHGDDGDDDDGDDDDGDDGDDGDGDGDDDHGDDDDGNDDDGDGLPGKSVKHNPHGGPPSKLGMTPAKGPGLGVASHRHASSKHEHSHKH
jgi:hypothetical protein